MSEIEDIGDSHQTSIEIVRAIADLVGEGRDAILEALESPADFDEIVSRARHLQEDIDEPLYWNGREVL